MGHYDKHFEEQEKEKMAFQRRHLIAKVDLMTDDEVKYMLKIAENLKEYQSFESTMRKLFGTKR